MEGFRLPKAAGDDVPEEIRLDEVPHPEGGHGIKEGGRGAFCPASPVTPNRRKEARNKTMLCLKPDSLTPWQHLENLLDPAPCSRKRG